MPEPEFVEMPESFRVNLYRKSLTPEMRQDGDEISTKDGESSEKFGESSVKFGDLSINETQKGILRVIERNNYISAASIAETMGVTTRAIEKNIKELRERGILIRHGAARGGYWEIKKNK